MVNKKAVIIVTIITIILIATIVGYFILKLYISEDIVETDVTTKNNYSNDTNITQNNSVVKEDENTNNNDKPDKDENTTNNEKNSTSNNTSNTEKTDTNKPSSNTSSDKLENGEDAAISLAKKKYNKDDKNVYYYVEEQLDHDVYVISVRKKSTTASIIQYEVNITTEEVTEY